MCFVLEDYECVGVMFAMIGIVMIFIALSSCDAEHHNKAQKPQTQICCCKREQSRDACGQHSNNSVNVKYCPHCGELINETHCSECNELINEGDKFCTNCGNAVNTAKKDDK